MSISIPPTAKDKLDALLASAVSLGRLPGAAFAVGTADAELYHGSAGLRYFDEPEKGSIDEESVFWICSMTKLVVTVALLQLIEKGVLDYDTPAEKYLPELANPLIVDDMDEPVSERTYTPAKNKILVRHLLCHTSGVAYALPGQGGGIWPYDAASYEGDHTVKKFFSLLQMGLPGFPIAFEPGTDWIYGWSSELVSIIVERISGQTIQEYCEENIFTPLGIKMSFLLTPEWKNKLVQLTLRAENGQLEKWSGQIGIIEQDPKRVGILFGGSGLHSTMRDYLTFLRHILAIKEGRASKSVLSQKSIDFIFTPQIEERSARNIEPESRWPSVTFGGGIALAPEDWPGRRKRGSGFWYGWAGTYFFMDPATGIAAVYGTQVVPSRDAEAVKLLEDLERAVYESIDRRSELLSG